MHPGKRAVVLLLFSPTAFASPILNERALSDICQIPQIKPLIQSIANSFPKTAVNSFCSSVLGPNNVPKTTITTAAATSTKHVTETLTDTYTATTTKCVTKLAKRNPSPLPEAEAAPAAATVAPALNRDSHGRLFGFPASIVSEACKCVVAPVTVTQTVTAVVTTTDYDFAAATKTLTTTTIITKTLPTFVAQFKGGPAAVNDKWLQVKALKDSTGQFLANAVALVPRNLATPLTLACEGYLVQQNTTGLGIEGRNIATHAFAITQAPIYFDAQRTVDVLGAGAGEQPLICSIAASKLKCYALEKTQNVIEYCPLYEEFFETSILLGPYQGPQCSVLEVAVTLV